MMAFSLGQVMIGTPSPEQMTRAAVSQFQSGRCASAFRVSRGLSSRGAENIALCPDCEPCAGWLIFKLKRRVVNGRRDRNSRTRGGQRGTPAQPETYMAGTSGGDGE